MFKLIHNTDGTVCRFRVGCLVALALCMLSYGGLNLRERAYSEQPVAETAQTAEPMVQAPAARLLLPAQDPFVQAKVAAMGEFFESISYYQTCGSLNRGFEGCSFSFSETVTSLYAVDEEASDDGFILSLRLHDPKQDSTCTALSYSSSGELTSFDEAGNHTEQQCFLEVEHAHAGVVSASGEDETELN